MTKPEISIVMPGIRVSNWEAVYQSIQKSTKKSFELIIIGPYILPESLQIQPNVKYIKDYGNVVRCYNMGSTIAEGCYMTCGADDGVFAENALDILIDDFEALPYNPKNIFNAKYTEGGNELPERFFIINNAPETVSPYIGNDWYILMQPFLYTKYFIELGGLDAIFEAWPMALIDFAVRAYRDGAQVYFNDINVQHVTHQPGHTGDHGPIHNGQNQNDIPLFQKIHKNQETLMRIKIAFDNWKKAPSIWERRFGKIQ